LSRPPVGFIVEGTGEYLAYGNIVRKGVRAAHGKLPIVNSYGCTALLHDLEQSLVDLTLAHHPVTIIVTLDMRDPIQAAIFPDCLSLRTALQDRADRWLAEAIQNGVPTGPLPDTVRIVIQVQTFESWLVADAEGLRRAPPIRKNFAGHACSDVDSELEATTFLKDSCKRPTNLKHRDFVLQLSRCIKPQRAAASSRSFRKFWDEVVKAYERWREVTGEAFELLP